MTAKYSTDQDDAARWDRDRRYVFAEWSTNPFVGVRHRHETVEHRLVLEYHHGVGVDMLHECRSEDTEKFSDEWEIVESIEVREYGARHDRRHAARGLQ